jgi:hypothetical protein
VERPIKPLKPKLVDDGYQESNPSSDESHKKDDDEECVPSKNTVSTGWDRKEIPSDLLSSFKKREKI